MLPSKRLCFYCCFLLLYLVLQIFIAVVLPKYNRDPYTNAFKTLEIYKKLSTKLKQPTEVDISGLYKIIKIKSSRVKSKYDVTVVSQCSSNHFLSVESLFKAWEGPISIAVYLDVENIEISLWDMARFLHCYNWRDFQMQLVVPVQKVYELNYNFAFDFLYSVENSVSCTLSYVSTTNIKKNYEWSSTYPINLLRNVAKKETSTDYILVIDIDMIPSSKLRYDFLNFAKETSVISEKVVFVVPVFEIPEDVPVPMNKTELITLYLSLKARPFYAVPCSECQRLTGYVDWMASENYAGVKVLNRVKWKHPWEPFFIAKSDIADFDERFKQYGMNRVSQICELHVAGFEFLVLDNAFLIHKGFKNAEDFHESKNQDMETNRRLYKRFKTEIKYKYPDIERSC